MRFSEQGRRDLEQWQSNGSNGVLNDDRIRKALARSLGTSTGTTTAEGSRFTQDVRDTRQDNQSVKEAFKSLLESISATDQTRNANLNKLVRLVNNLSDQLQDFKTQNKALTEQLQVLEMQVSKLKK
jgi:predicted  nucleic acid-binding Zn-ribbon protein